MKKILTVLIMLFILIFLISFIMLPKEKFSEIENRGLSSFPKFELSKIMDGSYMEDVESYVNDHFPVRNIFMNIRAVFNKCIGRQNIDDVYFGNDDYLIEKYDDVLNKDKIVDVINKLDENVLTDIGVMLVPTKISIYEDKLPKYVSVYSQDELINNIYNKLNDNIKKINLYDNLIKEKDNYQLFYKTDHHWTSYGAYFGYKEFARENNLEFIDISLFDIDKVSDSFLGSTYSKVVLPNVSGEDMYIFNYKDYDLDISYVLSNKNTKSLYNYDYLDKKDKYAMFLDNNHPLITIKNNDINNGGNLLIIKDSFANSMVPFLVNHYSNIHVVDPRYYKRSISNYIVDNNIDSILILYNIGTLSSDDNILSIR